MEERARATLACSSDWGSCWYIPAQWDVRSKVASKSMDIGFTTAATMRLCPWQGRHGVWHSGMTGVLPQRSSYGDLRSLTVLQSTLILIELLALYQAHDRRLSSTAIWKSYITVTRQELKIWDHTQLPNKVIASWCCNWQTTTINQNTKRTENLPDYAVYIVQYLDDDHI